MWKWADEIEELVPGVDRPRAGDFDLIVQGLSRDETGMGVSADGYGVQFEGPPMVPTTFRWGKLDGSLVPGGTQTVSLWEATGGGWHGWDEDSGLDEEDVYASPLFTSGTIAGGSMVLIADINGRWVVLQPWC